MTRTLTPAQNCGFNTKIEVGIFCAKAMRKIGLFYFQEQPNFNPRVLRRAQTPPPKFQPTRPAPLPPRPRVPQPGTVPQETIGLQRPPINPRNPFDVNWGAPVFPMGDLEIVVGGQLARVNEEVGREDQAEQEQRGRRQVKQEWGQEEGEQGAQGVQAQEEGEQGAQGALGQEEGEQGAQGQEEGKQGAQGAQGQEEGDAQGALGVLDWMENDCVSEDDSFVSANGEEHEVDGSDGEQADDGHESDGTVVDGHAHAGEGVRVEVEDLVGEQNGVNGANGGGEVEREVAGAVEVEVQVLRRSSRQTGAPDFLGVEKGSQASSGRGSRGGKN